MIAADHSDYLAFLRSKIRLAAFDGFDVDDNHVNPLLKPHQRDIVRWAVKGGNRAIFAAFGLGKCHGIGTKIMMADGSVKNVEDVAMGDQLMGADSRPRNVLSLARGREAMYRITLKNGDSYTCNESHILALRVSNRRGHHRPGDDVTMALRDWLQLPDYAKRNCYKHYKVGIDFPSQAVPMDAYLFGAWLGDGDAHRLAWTINHNDRAIVPRIEGFAAERGLSVRITEGDGCAIYHATQGHAGKTRQCDEFYFVQTNGAQGKRIDARYLKNDQETRLQLLAGLLDTDGHLIDNCYEIATKWPELRDDIVFLARSLGFATTYAEKPVNGQTYWRIWISGHTDKIPCITRKKAGARGQIKNPMVYGFDVQPLGEGDYYGFEIDGDHLYLLGDFTVTHNTFMQIEALRLIHAHAGGKCLVVTPLGVRHEFKRDGEKLGVHFEFIRRADEMQDGCDFYLTNYESIRDGKLEPSLFTAVSLDEASVLRSYGSKTYQEFLPLFNAVRFKFVATATPSPNRYKELIHYAGFLNIMDTGQALTRFFQRDSTQANNLTLYPHKLEEFYLWLHSWAIFLQRPSDICQCPCHKAEVA